jgi:hypothetical protein
MVLVVCNLDWSTFYKRIITENRAIAQFHNSQKIILRQMFNSFSCWMNRKAKRMAIDQSVKLYYAKSRMSEYFSIWIEKLLYNKQMRPV